jgi:deoxyribodipyrimidine photo-lyase
MPSIVWFRQDLRVRDNPALAAAAARGSMLPVYILDEATPPSAHRLGGASRWWLHHSLAALGERLGGLLLLRGDPRRLLPTLVEQVKAEAVFWNRCYEPSAIRRDTTLKTELLGRGVEAASFNGSLLHEPWEPKTKGGEPFKVYTPFWRACLSRPIDAPKRAPTLDVKIPGGLGDRLEDWRLVPSRPNWAAGWHKRWTPGEQGATRRLDAFIVGGLDGYGALRDRPDLPHISRLSPHLHFGEISPRQIWARVETAVENGDAKRKDADKFLSEIGWREFAHHLLYHYPTLPEENWRPVFDAYPWRHAPEDLQAWRRGRTGYPLVDAGMRELWRTGFMHNRIRMVTASFLIKHLRIDWRQGEAWFWDTLLDADLANNAAGWQWVAGSGADAAPYFRIFNPIEQGRKFDPDGVYVRRWCPELAKLPDRYLHAPFEAPAEVLAQAEVRLGETYPAPIVDHAEARRAALAGYQALKGAAAAN